jgi:hypothetical protein
MAVESDLNADHRGHSELGQYRLQKRKTCHKSFSGGSHGSELRFMHLCCVGEVRKLGARIDERD